MINKDFSGHPAKYSSTEAKRCLSIFCIYALKMQQKPSCVAEANSWGPQVHVDFCWMELNSDMVILEWGKQLHWRECCEPGCRNHHWHTAKKQENAENEKQSSDLQKLMTVHFAVRKLGYFKWAVSPSTDILQFTSESLWSGRTAARQRETGSEIAIDQLWASNREKQKRNTCSAVAFQTVHYKSCCFLQVLVFLFSQGKEIKKNMERIMCKLWPCRELKAPLWAYQLT